MICLCPAHKEIIKRVALGHVALYFSKDGASRFVGANRQLLEELRQMKLVTSFRKNTNCWQYTLTDAGRLKLVECFPVVEEEESEIPVKTSFCKHCGRAFTPNYHRRVYCGECGNPLLLSKRQSRDRAMQDDARHDKKIACHVKWREWAKENDPMYYIRKAEAQARWKAKQKAAKYG